jgi:hypothetical protein
MSKNASLIEKTTLNWHQTLKNYLKQLRAARPSSGPPARKGREAVAEIFY